MIEGERTWEPVLRGDDSPPPAGAYSPAVRAGNLLFVSGQVPRDPRTGELVGGEIEEQTRQVIANVASVLKSGGASLADVVSVTVYLSDPDLWGRFNAAYRDLMPQPYPSRTAVGCSLKGILVEVSVIAHVAG